MPPPKKPPESVVANAAFDKISVSMTELEIKFVYQQETIESLNEQVTKQWKVIDQLTHKLGMLHDQMSSMVYDGEKASDDPPPPHY